MRFLIYFAGLLFLGGQITAEGKEIQEFLGWSIGMSNTEALSPQRTGGDAVKVMPSDGWHKLDGEFTIPFPSTKPGKAKISLRFDRNRLVQIYVTFLVSKTEEQAAKGIRDCEEYFRKIGEIARDPAFDVLGVEKEIKQSSGQYTYHMPEHRYVSFRVRLNGSDYWCAFSISDNGRGITPITEPKPKKPKPKKTETKTAKLETWETNLSGDPKVVFKKRLATINALLVRPLEGGGNAASAMKLSVTAIPNNSNGSITIGFNQPIGEDMRRASEEVVRAIQVKHGALPGNMDVEFGFADKWGGKDGPSAAVACALLLESLFEGFQIPGDLAVTGDLNADSTVQPVGGVADKIRGAMELNCTIIGVPAANEDDITDLVVEENLKRFLKVKVFTLTSLDDAIDLANSERRNEDQKQAIEDFGALQKELLTGGTKALYFPATSDRLTKILSSVPNLYSAKILLTAARRRLPTHYSLVGTLIRIDKAMAPFANSIKEIRGGASIEDYQFGRNNPLLEARNRLLTLKVKSDKRLVEVINAEITLILKFQNLINSNAKSATVLKSYLKDLNASADRSDAAWKAVRSNKEIQDQLMKRGINFDSGE